MKLIWLPIGIIAWLGCSTEEEKPVTYDPNYDLWSQLLVTEYIHESTKLVVLQDSTTNWWMHHLSTQLGYIKKKIPGIDTNQVKELVNINLNKMQLKSDFMLAIPYTFITQTEEEELFGSYEGGGWGEFYRRYPDSAGIIAVSIPLFVGSNYALVCAEQMVEDLAGSGDLYVMKKTDNKWIVTASCQIWISR
jgi:hypothetical protein